MLIRILITPFNIAKFITSMLKEKLLKDLLNLLRQYFQDYSTNIILVNRFTIGSLFRHKDTVNKGSRSAVVYKYVCSACGTQYVGSTTRGLATRAAEHHSPLNPIYGTISTLVVDLK